MSPTARCLLLTTSILVCPALPGRAGHEISDGKKQVIDPAPVRAWFPDEPRGMATVGGMFSSDLSGVFFDAMAGLWAPQQRDAFLFLNSRYTYEDNGQFLRSTGLGFRQLLPAQQVIIGVNAFWDSIHSQHGSDFDQLGLGAEILTKWVDARFNYYLPEDDQVAIGRRSEREFRRSVGPGVVRQSASRRLFESREAALEGFNAEIGVLLPLCKFTEVRLYGGYYHYDNPFGSDFEGFKARLEARLLPGVIADVEWWDDAALMGGHWTAGIRASVPFSIYNLATGRNPFEGISESFTPREREFKERMGDMIERSHRVQTTSSGDRLTGTRDTRDTTLTGGAPVLRSTVAARGPGGALE